MSTSLLSHSGLHNSIPSVHFQYPQKSSPRRFAPEGIELVFFNQLSEVTSAAVQKQAAPGRLTSEAISQLEKKLKALRAGQNQEKAVKKKGAAKETPSPESQAAQTPQTLTLYFSSGGKLILIGLAPKAAPFELHTALRTTCEELLVSARASDLAGLPTLPVRINTRALSKEQDRAVVEALSFLAIAGGWKPHRFTNSATDRNPKKKKKTPQAIEILSQLSQSELQQVTEKSRQLAVASRTVRTLADLPANELNPTHYRKLAAQLARAHRLRFKFLDFKKLTRMKAGAFLAVARADDQDGAGIVHLSYVPKKRASGKARPVVLVGKGICFDTGGYNIKPGSSMLGMHGDMTGSAIALALICMYAELKVDFEVHAYLALAQNLISPHAYKPNEIVTACDGTTIEVVDTDAEGRMVLADTLAIARRLKPGLCLDFATLTGAAIRSLDTRRGAVFSQDEALAQKAVQAGKLSGERVWNFPIGEDYRYELKSKVADLLQCHTSSNADHIYAATFLSHFIGQETPWVHLDLAPAENRGGLGLISSDTTGFGLAWADTLIRLHLA